MSVSDPAGLAGTIVPLAQQTQHPGNSIQLTDIIPQAAPQQTQTVMVPQQNVVQQQQMGIDTEISTLQQQSQQQMESQITLREQQGSASQPPMEQHQTILTKTVQTHQHEPKQQIFVQQPVPPVHTTPQQNVLPTQTGMEQRLMPLPQSGEQLQAYKPQPRGDTRDQTMVQLQQLQQMPQQQNTLLQQQPLLLEQRQTYVSHQLDQQQQEALLYQAQLQQHHLEKQHVLIQKKLFDSLQQQNIFQQQEQQPQQVLLQLKLEQQQQQPRVQQHPQSQLYKQSGQHQSGIQKESEKQQQSVSQQQSNKTQQQMEQQLQQQALLKQIEQQQQHAIKQQQVQFQQQMEQQQQALLLQQLEQHQQQALLQKQQAERLQQALMQQQTQDQQQAAIIHLQKMEIKDAVLIPQSNNEQQIQQQLTEKQHSYIPQHNSAQFALHTTLTLQSAAEQQQHAKLIRQQQGFAGQSQHHSSVMETHTPIGAPSSTEVIPQTQTLPQAQVPVAIQNTQIPLQPSAAGSAQVLTQQGQNVGLPQGRVPVQFISQPTGQAASAQNEAQEIPQATTIQGQGHITYAGSVPAQGQLTAQEVFKNQSLKPHDQGPTVGIQMMSQQSQPGFQPTAVITSTHGQPDILYQQNPQTSGLRQHQPQQQTHGPPVLLVHAQTAAELFTPQCILQPTHPERAPTKQDITHITQQQQQESLQQYHQKTMLPSTAESVAPTRDHSLPVTHPIATSPQTVQQTGQNDIPDQKPLNPVVQAQQQPTGSSTDPSVFEPMPHSQYKQQLQKLSQAQQPLAPSCPQAQFILTPTQQSYPPKQVSIPFEENPLSTPAPSHLVTHPTVQAVPSNLAGPQNMTPPSTNLVSGVPPSPQHQAKQMLPVHARTQTSIQPQTHTHIQTQTHSHAQTFSETPVCGQSALPHAVFPASQMLLSSSRTSCPPTSLPSLPSLPSYYPAGSPLTELPTSHPVAMVTSPEQADFIPTSPPPVTPLHSLDSNAPKPPQAVLQDCDPSLLGTAQVQEE